MGRPKKKIQILEALTLEQKKRRILESFFSEIEIKEPLLLDEWSDKYRVLTSESSSEDGPWRTDRFPFVRRIMFCLSPQSIAEEPVWMKGSQIAGTETAICWALYCPDQQPGPFVYLQKTKDAVQEFSTQKLKPSILACSRLHHLLGAGKPNGYADSIDEKGYPGGYIRMGPANSALFLRSKSVGKAVADEEDSYEKDVSGEGSPIALLKKRMTNFPGKKLYRLSTPLHKETSTIEPAFKAGSMERYYVPCPHCNPEADRHGTRFWLRWNQIKWSDEKDSLTGLPLEVWLECPTCGGRIEEAEHKTWMLENGLWLSEKGNAEGDLPYEVGDVVNPSFHLSSLYSPLGFFSWADAVKEWFTYLRIGDPFLLQVFVNTVLAETFDLTGGEFAFAHLKNRCENYKAEIPRNALLLTAGVDIQDNRIEISVIGWGMFEERWSIDFVQLMGDPSQPYDRMGNTSDGLPSVWTLLDQYLAKRFKHEAGHELPIECTMIDAGFLPEMVHRFCAPRESRRIFPVHGQAGWKKGLFAAPKRRHEEFRTCLYTAYTDELKLKNYSAFKIDKPGPGYCHFPQNEKHGKHYFKGLTCERMETKIVRGQTVLFWDKPPGARNEPIDCMNYATVAYLAYPVDFEARARLWLSK